MSLAGALNISDYSYDLPHHRIAEHPVANRDHSRLLLANRSGISEARFYDLPVKLPGGGMMVFNDTRVIRARLVFAKDTGARIEVFCLEPVSPYAEISKAFGARSPVQWKCLVGNARKWRGGKLSMSLDGVSLHAEKIEQIDDTFIVEFSWHPERVSFAEILEKAGKVPLPPYIEREAEDEDVLRYQTIYARHDGSVAAPTAGLHFTENVLDALNAKSITMDSVILHVSAGTFKPVDRDDIREHEMHNEQIIVGRKLVEDIMRNEGSLTAVGTTSMRTLESIYWYGTMLIENNKAPFAVTQWLPYRDNPKISRYKAMEAVLRKMDKEKSEELAGNTSLIIVPGYGFHVADILLTNFHMPRSTLLLLVAAFYGPRWRDAYAYALEHDFRFLSYGDSCLFFRHDHKG